MNKSLAIVIILITFFVSLLFLNNPLAEDIPDDPDRGESEPVIMERTPGENYIDQVRRLRGVELPIINARAAYSVYYDGEGNEKVLYSRNRNEKLPIASITKLMTALIIYENYDISSPVKVSDSVIFSDSQLADLRIFSNTTYKDLLHSLLLESNNSAAYLASIAPEDIDFYDFIEIMNQRANELGMSGTKFYNPSGLDNLGGVNLSTPRDLVKLTERLLEIPLFWEIMQKDYYNIYSSADLYYRVETTNRFLNNQYFNYNNPDWHDMIMGGKTGFTHQSLGCLIIVLEDEENDGYIINIILGAGDHHQRFEEMEKLIDWVFKAYEI